MTRKLISFDWAIKKLLRSKANFGILEGFLSELLFTDYVLGKIEGVEEGIKQGVKQGEKNKSREVAKKWLHAGIPVKTISLMMGLSKGKLKNL